MLARITLLLAVCYLVGSGVFADESKVPEPFRGETPGSPIVIQYDDWSEILRRTVVVGGRSDRERASKIQPKTGTRLVSGNTSSTRNEGNRIAFPAFDGDNLTIIHNIRKQLEAIPGQVPMQHWTKNEQLAYWLNLYNITLVELLAHEYPVKKLTKLMKGSKKNPSLWDRKVLNVAGIPLSLNDIQFNILLNKWNSTLVPYGLFQGYIGGPNLMPRAFTGDTVHAMLVENATEFVNSNRGMMINGNTLKVSKIYEMNRDLFPNWTADLKKHFGSLVDFGMRDRIMAAKKIKASTTDYYIADIFGGGAQTAGTTLASNNAALFDMRVHVTQGEGGATAGLSGFSSDAFLVSYQKADIDVRFPSHVKEYIESMRLRNNSREGRVDIEELQNVPQKPAEKKEEKPE